MHFYRSLSSIAVRRKKVMSRRWEGLVKTAKFAVAINLMQMFFIILTMLVW
jgi:hypothetical protein